MVADKSLQHLILQVFEEEEDNFWFPLTSQKQARAFVRSLHTKGIEYKDLCELIGEFEHNFVSWRKGIGRPGIGKRIIELINKPLVEILLSDGEEEDDDEDEEDVDAVDAVAMETKTNGSRINGINGEAKNKKSPQESIADSWASKIDQKIQNLELSVDTVAAKASQQEIRASEDSVEDKSSVSSKSSEGGLASDDEETKNENAPETATEPVETSETILLKETPSGEEESTPVVETVSLSLNLEKKTQEVEVKVTQDEVKVSDDEDEKLRVKTSIHEVNFRQRVPSEGGFISSEASSVNEEEISENYDSDLDLEGMDRDSEMAVLVRRVAQKKTELSDTKGFVYVFTDSSSTVTMQRVKVGASRFPNRRLEQAMHYNVDIQQVTAIKVDDRRAALRDILQRLHRFKVKGHEDWFQGPLDQMMKAVKEITSRYTDCDTDC